MRCSAPCITIANGQFHLSHLLAGPEKMAALSTIFLPFWQFGLMFLLGWWKGRNQLCFSQSGKGLTAFAVKWSQGLKNPVNFFLSICSSTLKSELLQWGVCGVTKNPSCPALNAFWASQVHPLYNLYISSVFMSCPWWVAKLKSCSFGNKENRSFWFLISGWYLWQLKYR